MSKSTRLTLVCHGATAATRAGTFPCDDALEPAELERARKCGGSLPHAHRAWTSQAQAARQTAKALGLTAIADPAVNDIDYGRWAGLGLNDLYTAEPENVAAWLGDTKAAPHGGESFDDLLVRVSGWLHTHIDDGGHAIVVTHALVIRAAMIDVLEAPRSAIWRIDVEPLGLVNLNSDGRRWMLRTATL